MTPTVELATGPLPTVADADVLAVPVRRDGDHVVPGPGAEDAEASFGIEIADELALAKAKGGPGEITAVPVAAEGLAVEQVLLVGVGDGGVADLRKAGAALGRRVRDRRRLATTVGTDGDDETLRSCVEGLLLASYSFSRKSSPKKPAPVESVVVTSRSPRRVAPTITRAEVTARAVHLARDLANTPANEKDPAWLAERAVEAAAAGGVSARVRDEGELAEQGWGGVLAVGMGSARPPRVVEMTYEPAGRSGRVRHVVLVGKGITFDTGGLSLKRPYESMVAMKTDMAGAAAVIAVMGALRDAGVRVRVTGLVAAAENMPSGSAQRPGDVITQYGGTTVEVRNTDAEGRLVLADALAYADRRLVPDMVVDVATLTGAATLGLGRRHAALYSTDDGLADALLAAGAASGDRVWRMPLVDDYGFALESEVADLCHIATDPHVSGGSITAALFLRHFAGRRRWAHLDIAGPARADAEEDETTKGATGYGARLLLRWLEGLR